MDFGEDDIEELTAFKEIYEAYADTNPAINDDNNADDHLQSPTEASDIYLSQAELAKRFAEKQQKNKPKKVELELSLEAGAKAMAKVLKILRDEDGELASADQTGDSKKEILVSTRVFTKCV